MSRTPKLDVPMDTTLSIRTTRRAADTFRSRAATRGMSLGEYLDYLTTRSAIVNDLATIGDNAPLQPVREPAVFVIDELAPMPDVQPGDPATCHITGQPHRAGGFGGTGVVQRCQDCGMRKISGRWTGLIPTPVAD